MQLSSDIFDFSPDFVSSAAPDSVAAVLGSVPALHPAELTHVYTSGYALAYLPGPPLRIIYALSLNRRIIIAEMKWYGGRFNAVAPLECEDDNTVDGLAVNPQFLWIDLPDGRQRLRLYCVAEQSGGGTWTLRWVDLPIYRQRQVEVNMGETPGVLEVDESKTVLEITDDPTALRSILQEVINVLRSPDGRPKSRENALAVTKLQEARFWLTEGMMND